MPRWLLLDEAAAGLDIAHRLQITEGARWFAARENGVVAVIHALNLTVMFADRGVRMAGGRVAGVMTNEVPVRAYGRALRVNVAPHRGIPALSDATEGQDA